MRKKKFNTELEFIYKNVFICKICGEKYGQDSNIPKHELCPICERALSRPKGLKKKNGHKN